MEFLEGQTLAEKRMPLPVPQVLKIGAQIAEGLAAAHKQGIIHRNLQALERDDHRLGRVSCSTSRCRTTSTPTRRRSRVEGGEGDARADIFSLGVLLYEMPRAARLSAREQDGLMAAILERDRHRRRIALGHSAALDRLIRNLLKRIRTTACRRRTTSCCSLRATTEMVRLPLRKRLSYRAMIAVVAVLARRAGGYALFVRVSAANSIRAHSRN